MSRRSLSSALVLALALVPLAGCSFHNTARAWNGLVGADGEPVFYTSTTKVGVRFLVIIPLFGNLEVDGMIDDVTQEIAAAGGDHIRIVQGTTEAYWYGFPPVTWVFTPVVSRVDADWRPSKASFSTHRHEWASGLEHGDLGDDDRCEVCLAQAEEAARREALAEEAAESDEDDWPFDDGDGHS